MKNKYLSTVLLAAIAFSPLAVTKAASLIGVNYGSSLEANVNTGVNINTDLNQNAGLDTAVEADAESNSQADTNRSNAGNGVNLNANLNNSIEGEIMRVRRADLEDESNMSAIANFRNSWNMSQNSSANRANVDSEGNVSAGAGIPNTGESAVENANENAFENASEQSRLLRAESVATQEDLRIFAMAALEDNENLEAMSFANDEVEVSYKADGRFIGIIPVTMAVDVNVSQDGEVEFDYPWYSFLIVKDMEDLEASIQSEVDAAISAGAEGGWTNYDRAKLAASIVSALQAHYEANTATSTDEEV